MAKLVGLALSAALQRGLLRLSKVYDCGTEELARVAIEEMIAAHRRSVSRPRAPRPAPRQVRSPKSAVHTAPEAPNVRKYAAKPCAGCERPFYPAGPRSKWCLRCVGTKRPAPPSSFITPAKPGDELETVWDGSIGRRAAQ